MRDYTKTPNYHAIEVKYLGPTESKGSRVRLRSLRFGGSKTIPYSFSFNNIAHMAAEWLEMHGYEIVGFSESSKGYIVITSTFKSLKDK